MGRSGTPSELDDLRSEIARLDRSLVMLLAARYRAVHDIFRLKRREGRPKEDLRQEAVVLARAREWAEDIGAPPIAIQRVFERILESGKESDSPSPPAFAERSESTVTLLLSVPSAPIAQRTRGMRGTPLSPRS